MDGQRQGGRFEASEEEKACRVYVRGLWEGTDRDDLRSVMEEFGAVTWVTIPKDRETLKSRRFGFVTFSSPEGVEALMARQKQSPVAVDGCEIEVQRMTDERPPLKPRESFEAINARTIFVSNLSPKSDTYSLRQNLSKFGAIDSVRVLLEPESKMPRGSALVTFAHKDGAQAALQAQTQGQGINIDGQNVAVAQKRSFSPQGNRPYGGGGGGGGRGDRDGGDRNRGDRRERREMHTFASVPVAAVAVAVSTRAAVPKPAAVVGVSASASRMGLTALVPRVARRLL